MEVQLTQGKGRKIKTHTHHNLVGPSSILPKSASYPRTVHSEGHATSTHSADQYFLK